MTTISTLPAAPNPLTDSQSAFNAKALAWTLAHPTFVAQVNAVAGEVNANAAAAAQSAIDATINGAAQVALAEDQVAMATTQAQLATINGAAQVALAEDQVAMATTQAQLAEDQVAMATTQAQLATINGAAQVAIAATHANAAAGAANYKGVWSSLSGALTIPASVFHNGTLYVLLASLTNVAASEPGISSDWINTSPTNHYFNITQGVI